MTGPGSNRTPHPLPLNRGEIYYHLRSRLPRDHEALLSRVDELRASSGLDRVLGIGLITLSSICIRDCIYCGYRASNVAPGRFRLSRSEILSSARAAAAAGIKWLILKAGDDPGLSPGAVSELVRELHSRQGFFLSLSMGERDPGIYSQWHKAGAASYWLRHETCDPHLYRRIRPAMYWVDRVRNLEAIKASGFLLGTGIIVGMPNQSYESLLEDVLLLTDPAIKALVVEPYHPPVGSKGHELMQKPENLIINAARPGLEKVISICRILHPRAVITLTQAHLQGYAALEGRELFRAGANALVLDFTPPKFRDFEVEAPFTGHPAADPGAIDMVRAKLQAQGLELVFTPPAGVTA